MGFDDLASTAQAMVSPGQGILAADESTGTMNKRLAGAGLPQTEEYRKAYRNVILTTRDLGDYISGIILFDETIRQTTTDGVPAPEAAKNIGVIPGIKVDEGAKPMAGAPGEKVTEGLDGLRERLAEYAEMGAKFAKWRAVLQIGDGIPTWRCVQANAHALARYAALCQEAGLVPMVEPEVLMEGDHTLTRCEEVTTATLQATYNELEHQQVRLEGTVLKPNMVLAGKDCPEQPPMEDAVEATLRTLRRSVPPAVPGIAFLSGGQSDEAATVYLDAINRRGPHPWQITFSYGRALLAPTLSTWNGDPANTDAAHETLYHRAWCNAAARDGRYDPSMERERPMAHA